MSFGARLRKERLRRHLSQEALAEALSTIASTISRWERDLTFPHAHYRIALCRLFGVRPEELFEETPDCEQAAPEQPFWHVPYSRNPFFTGREEVLQRLHEMLGRTHTLALTQSLAISGLGGIGKTQIALEYAHRYRQAYRFVFWASAATQEALLADVVAIADHLQLPERAESDHKKVLRALKQWFATHREWLLILDNADDAAILHDIVPTDSPGHLLLTSRAQALGPLLGRLEVEKMGMVEATLLLLHRARSLPPDASLDQAREEHLAAAEAIAIEMDFLPLALDQAGAYIDEVGCSLSAYLEMYRAHRKELLQRRGQVATAHPDSVATTWSLNFQRVKQTNPAAADLLHLCAFLEPDIIPEELLTGGNAFLGPVLQPVAADAFALNAAIEELRKFSLVSRDPEIRLLRVHRLVQAVLKDAMEPEEQQQWAERVICTVHALFPQKSEDVASWSQCLRYLEQVRACDTIIQQYQFVFPEAADLLERAGTYLRERGLYLLVEPLYQRALCIWEQLVGPTHLQVATCLCNLAILYRVQGIYAQAEHFFQRAQAIQEHVLGPEHPDVANTLNNLAAVYRRQGMYEQAESLFRRALDIWERTLGATHSAVAMALGNLANLYREQGKYHLAEPLFQQALDIEEQILDPGHPRLAKTLNNLAIFYSVQRKYEQAEPLFQRALLLREQVFGANHPDVATSLNNLANVSIEQGKYDQAEPLLQRALRIREQSLGPEHTSVASSLHNLAYLYRERGKYDQAESLFQRSLRIREHTLIPKHPEIAEVLHDFAKLREAQGQCQEAEFMYQRALAIREEVLGSIHSKTEETRTQYLALLRAMGREEEVAHIERFRSE